MICLSFCEGIYFWILQIIRHHGLHRKYRTRSEILLWKTYEDDNCISIIDLTRCAAGNCLIVPREQGKKFSDLSDHEITKLCGAVKTVSHLIRKANSPSLSTCSSVAAGRPIFPWLCSPQQEAEWYQWLSPTATIRNRRSIWRHQHIGGTGGKRGDFPRGKLR